MMNKAIILLLFLFPSFIFSKNYYSIKVNKGTITKLYDFKDETETEKEIVQDLETLGLVFDITPVKKLGLWSSLSLNYLYNPIYLEQNLSGSKKTPENSFNYSSDFNIGISYTTKSKISKLQYCIGGHLNWLAFENSKSLTTGFGAQFSYLFPIKDITWISIGLSSSYDIYELYKTDEESGKFISSFISSLQIGISL